MTPNVTALIANAMVRSVVAMMMPASAGPTMNDSSPRVANRLLAGPSSRSSRTRLGRYAPIAGRKKHEKQVARIASTTTTKHRSPGRDDHGHRDHDQARGRRP